MRIMRLTFLYRHDIVLPDLAFFLGLHLLRGFPHGLMVLLRDVVHALYVGVSELAAALGRSMVNELLSRLSTRAAFVTVSGRADDPLKPVLLYKACGFTGETLWRVIRKN